MRMVWAWDNQGVAPAGWGSHLAATWAQFEPSKGVYDFGLFERGLAKGPRPCYLQLAFALLDKATGAPVDYSPKQHKRSLKLTAGGKSGEIPPYDAAWTDALCRAIEALGAHFRGVDQVAGFWLPAGIDNESQVVPAGEWASATKAVLGENVYCDGFLPTLVKRSLASWGEKPVYLPGAPSPGNVWGKKRRDVIESALRSGAGYMNCGLQTDNDTAFGIGEYAGKLMFDIAGSTARRGFEEGHRCAPDERLEVYWLLLRAMHWGADFVNLYGGISAPQAEIVEGMLPAKGWRWIVFRSHEFAGKSWTTGGKVYGQMGEPGCWGRGIELYGSQGAAATLLHSPACYGFERWTLASAEPIVLTLAGLADGRHRVAVWDEHGVRSETVADLQGGRLTLPAGKYHRVDVREAVEEVQPLSLEERVGRLEERVAALERQALEGM